MHERRDLLSILLNFSFFFFFKRVTFNLTVHSRVHRLLCKWTEPNDRNFRDMVRKDVTSQRILGEAGALMSNFDAEWFNCFLCDRVCSLSLSLSRLSRNLHAFCVPVR